jgi:hypothetical protein
LSQCHFVYHRSHMIILKLILGFRHEKLVTDYPRCCIAAFELTITRARGTSRLRLKCDGTHAETRFRFSAKWTSPFNSAGASVQLTTSSQGVRISGCNAGYTKFRGSVKGTDYPFHSLVSPLTSPPVRHLVPSRFNWTLYLWYSLARFHRLVLTLDD